MITQEILTVYMFAFVVSQDVSMFSYNQAVSEFGNNMADSRPILSRIEKLKLKSLMKLLSDENISNPVGVYCQQFRICLECTKSAWLKCIWCHDYGCTEHPELICPNSMNYAQSIQRGGIGCSYLRHSGPMFIPAYVQTQLNLSVHIADPVLYSKEIICQIKLQNKMYHSKGTIDNNVINCHPFVLEIERLAEGENGIVNVIWGGMEPYSNAIPITVYHCESFADNCEACRIIPLEYGCGWCDEIEQCVISDKCPSFRLWNLNKLTCESEKKKLYYV